MGRVMMELEIMNAGRVKEGRDRAVLSSETKRYNNEFKMMTRLIFSISFHAHYRLPI